MRASQARLSYRIVKADGTVVVADLPHPHQSTWETRGMQLGAPGGGVVGRFTIPLYSPTGRVRFNRARDRYDVLDNWLRVEAYLGAPGAGQPFRTGWISAIHRSLDGQWSIEGGTDLALLAASYSFPGESWGGATGIYGAPPIIAFAAEQVFKEYCGLNRLFYGDDFSSGSLAAYTQTFGAVWTPGTAGPYAQPSVNVGADGVQGRLLVTNTFEPTAEWCLTTTFILDSASTSATNGGNAGLSVSTDALGQYDGYVILKKNADGSYNVDFNSQDVGVTDAFVNIQLPYIFTVQLSRVRYGTFEVNHATHTWTLNGKVMGSFAARDIAAATNRQFGLYYAGSAAGTGICTAQFLELCLVQRDTALWSTAPGAPTPRFALGTIEASTWDLGNQVDVAAQPYLELVTMAATFAGKYWRYTPSRLDSATGPFGTFDFMDRPGTDRTATAVFREGANLLTAEGGPNAEAAATKVQTGATPGTTGGGAAEWINLAAARQSGLLIEDQVATIPLADFMALAGHAQKITNNAATANQAKTITVAVDEISLAVRELDLITVDAPTLGWVMQSCQVAAIDFDEAAQKLIFYLDQWPFEMWAELGAQRHLRAIPALANSFATR